VNIDIARTHTSVCEQQRMRSGRVINVTPCIEGALAVFALAHLETIAGADDGERGGAAATAPTTGNAKHPRDLKQIHNTAEHPCAERDANGEGQNAHERIEN